MGKTRVLLSVKPKWCELFIAGQKNIEVRKTRPKLPTPFRGYLYMTKEAWAFDLLRGLGAVRLADMLEAAQGRVIGEFACKQINDLMISCSDRNMKGIPFPGTGMTDREIMDYLGNGVVGAGWDLSDFCIYGTPLSVIQNPLGLKAFRRPNILTEAGSTLSRPPQSWCYVEELRYG